MFSKSLVSFVLLAILSSGAQARIRIVERDGRALYGRRFGQESIPEAGQLGSACQGDVCGILGGRVPGVLLAGAGECAQQDLADDIIDAARKQDAATATKMIDLAKKIRTAEKNTPPDFSTNPPSLRNSVFCQKQPRNSELAGLNQAQDPANDPNLFFDPVTKKTVQKGSQANTSPLGGGAAGSGGAAGGAAPADPATPPPPAATDAATNPDNTATPTDVPGTCPPVATVTVTVDPAATATATGVPQAPDASTPAAGSGSNGGAAGISGSLSANINLGSCTDPTIRFGAGIEGRKETSFIPNNLKEFNHGSAQASGIITKFICDTFVNSCKADAAAQQVCQQALQAAAAAGAKQGAAADAFNAAFGFKSNFASIQAIDSQGKPVARRRGLFF
ncbi:hypothetical protein RhiJN_03211 [Ceratobasidium sp. AG-Ba]|nr:hypothetical protein RhiJN_03211 [Ceratobasidium sp. AG-Ba]